MDGNSGIVAADSPPHASLGNDEADQAGACLSQDPSKLRCLSYPELFERVSAGGLDFNGRSRDDAVALLERFGYYHLRGFWITFEHEGRFAEGTTIDDVLDIVALNDELSNLILDAESAIEIALRSRLSQSLVEAGGPFALENPSLFEDRCAFGKMQLILKRELSQGIRNAAPFATSNLRKYGKLPVWAALELASFGTLSRLYGNLGAPDAAKKVALSFGTKPHYLRNWLRCVTLMRNMCAHRNRIYNRMFPIQPTLYKEHARIDRMRLFPHIIVLLRMHDAVRPEGADVVRLRLRRIMDAHAGTDLVPIGFPDDWREVLGIPERAADGPRARGRGGGRPPKDADAVEEALFLYDMKRDSIAEICRKTGVGTTTLYKYIHLRA